MIGSDNLENKAQDKCTQEKFFIYFDILTEVGFF